MKHYTLHNKKGISMAETLAYIVLMGSVFVLLTSLVFFISKVTTKIYNRNKLTVENTTLYTQALSITTPLAADHVYAKLGDVYYAVDGLATNDGTSLAKAKPLDSTTKYDTVFFWKKYDYIEKTGEDKKVQVKTDTEASLKTVDNLIQFSYSEADKDITFTKSNPTATGSVSKMSISGVEITDASFNVVVSSTANTYVTFNGTMQTDNFSQAFSFVVPVFTTSFEIE